MTASMTRSITVSAPATEPLTLAEAKKHLEIATADTTHDTHVTNLITAARQVWEYDTAKLTSSRTVREELNDWPHPYWRTYKRPLISIDSITYYDLDNTSQTLSTAVYLVDAPEEKIHLAVDQDWPDITDRYDAITIRYTAGQTTVDEIAKQAIKLQVDLMFELRGTTGEEKNAVYRAYENLVIRYQRGSYP